MKKIALAAMLAACMVLLCGCTAVKDALSALEQKAGQHQAATPRDNENLDWSFVPVVRGMAEKTFQEGFPEAEITQTNVASVNGRDTRVIVVLSYTLGGKSGEYGFDYEKDDQGEYVLKRYGEGVGVEDLH